MNKRNKPVSPNQFAVCKYKHQLPPDESSQAAKRQPISHLPIENQKLEKQKKLLESFLSVS